MNKKEELKAALEWAESFYNNLNDDRLKNAPIPREILLSISALRIIIKELTRKTIPVDRIEEVINDNLQTDCIWAMLNIDDYDTEPDFSGASKYLAKAIKQAIEEVEGG